MPPNSPQTLLSLERFREICGAHPYFFWQLSNSKIPLSDNSDALFVEKTWQRGLAAARSDVRLAIAQAEQKLQTELGYDVSTRYRTEGYAPSRVVTVRSNAWYGALPGYNRQPWFGGGILNLNVGKLQRIATVSYEKLVDSSTLEYSDSDGDGLNDTFTGTFADTDNDPALVLVAFSEADQPANYVTDESSSPVDWQLRPVKVKRLNDNTLQISGPSWLLVKPKMYEHAPPSAGYNNTLVGVDSSGALNPDTATNFVTGLTAWLKVYSNEGQATLVRRNGSEETEYPITATIVDARNGRVAVDFCGCYDYGSCCTGPVQEEIRINYEAGATADFRRAQYLQYQTDWDAVTAHFAIALMPQVTTLADRKNSVFNFYRLDLAQVGSQQGESGQGYRVDNGILSNGFQNTRRGAVEAWQVVTRLAQVRAINIY